MPVPQAAQVQSDDPGESIIVLQKEASVEFPSPPPFRDLGLGLMEPRREIEERDEYEVTLSPKPRPQLSIPNWNAHNGESSKMYEAAKPNRYFPPQETTSGDASRGRKRKAMSEEDKQRANLVRRLGACPNCRRRKLAVSHCPSTNLESLTHLTVLSKSRPW
jgi:hypothetical protein